jgi:hypothetical protein
MIRGSTRPAREVRPPGLAGDVAEFRQVTLTDRWAFGLVAIGWVHLGTFLTCHIMFKSGNLSPPPYLALWLLEFLAVFAVLRKMVTGNGKHPAPPLVGLLARVWITFLILGFSVASLNNLTGRPPDWFKPVWGTLSTFGFAMMAWLVNLWFLLPAVQMSLTGVLMARFPADAYLIYGISWWVVLHLLALVLERLRREALARGETGQSAGTSPSRYRRYPAPNEPSGEVVTVPVPSSR